VTRDTQKELLEFIESMWDVWGETGVDNRAREMHEALRRLVEKFYGEWKPRAGNALSQHFSTPYPDDIAFRLLRDLHDFDPLKEIK